MSRAAAAVAAKFCVVLISPYELGRQPFALAHPAAHLLAAGFEVDLVDLSLQKLDPARLAHADVIGIYLGMHTAARIANEALPRLRKLTPGARLCAYGLYAPENAAFLHSHGVDKVFGAEFEADLLDWCDAAREGRGAGEGSRKVIFMRPARTLLPPLKAYAHLNMPDGSQRISGFVEASRGCKHLCRHCPVVPVYKGRFRAIEIDVVMEDIAQQVEAGAQHISFGDADFFNGPTHAKRIVSRMHERYPHLSYDCTIKIEHLLAQQHLLPELARTGCAFVTSAVESVDNVVLQHLCKGHSDADFTRAAELMRAHGIALAPTFVPFTPWTSADGYLELLRRLLELELVDNVPPIQLAIKLLVPRGSYLFEIPGFDQIVGAFDEKLFGYPWRHQDERLNDLQTELQSFAAQADQAGLSRRDAFAEIWRMAHTRLDVAPPALMMRQGQIPAHMSEPWYCCAEPTSQQLQSF